MPKPFPFVTDGTKGDVPNGFYVRPDSDRGNILMRTPGKSTLCTLSNTSEIRGAFANPGITPEYMYFVGRRGTTSVFWRVDPNTGVAAEIGTITTSYTGPIWIENNPTQISICDGVSMWIFTPATGLFVQNTDPDFVLGAGAMAYQDGYGLFIRPNSNVWGFTSINNFLSVDALDFYSITAKPGNLIGILSHQREPYLLTINSALIYYNYGGDNSSLDNPTFALNTAGLIEQGCGAAGTPNTGDGVIPNWLTNKGEWLAAAGYQAKKVSNEMMDRAVNSFPIFSDARCFSYRDKGHVFTIMNFPSGDQTWVMDWTTKLLHKRQSYKADGSGWGRDRANCYCTINNRHFVGDYENGKIYEMSEDFLDDAGNDIRRELYGSELDGGTSRLYCSEIQLLMKTGIGLESGLDPQVMLEISKDGGNTWDVSIPWVSAGKIGEYYRRARWTRLGSGDRLMPRLIFTDRVAWEILGLDMKVGHRWAAGGR